MKVINVNRKSQYIVRKMCCSERFSSIVALKEYLTKELRETVLDIGYIEPGHGMRGKQLWLVEDIDLTEMYELFKKKREFSLECFIQKSNPEDTRNNRKRRNNSTSDIAPQSKWETCAQTLNEVEEIVKKLQEKHGATYSVEQFNIWAHYAIYPETLFL